MFYKKLVLIVFIFCCSKIMAQTKNGEWQIGVGTAATLFSDENALLIGDKTLFQIPRLNVTVPFTEHITLDTALSFTTFDVGFITNEEEYFSLDVSLRYFFDINQKFFPYVFTGASLTDAGLNITPTINLGAGATYWINDIFGLNAQAYYKYSIGSSENVPSHIQVTAGMVFAIDLYDLFYGITSGCARSF